MARPTGWSPREQRLLLIVGVLVAAGLLGWVAWPLWERFKEGHERVRMARQRLVKLRELAVHAPAIEQAHTAYAALMTTEADEAVERAFLEELEGLAREGNVQISLKPGRVERTGRVTRVGVDVEADARQDELLGFLDRIFSWSGLIELERMRLSATSSKEHPLKGQFTLSRVVVHP